MKWFYPIREITMKYSALLLIAFLSVPVPILSAESDTAKYPSGSNNGCSEELLQWLLSRGNISSFIASSLNTVTIESSMSWKSVSTVSEDPGCPTDPATSPAWTQIAFDDSNWPNIVPCVYPPL
jgi:hypothetical protein